MIDIIFYGKWGRLVPLHLPFWEGLAAQLGGMQSKTALRCLLLQGQPHLRSSLPEQFTMDDCVRCVCGGMIKARLLQPDADIVKQYLLQSSLPSFGGLHCNLTSFAQTFLLLLLFCKGFIPHKPAKLYLSICFQRT